MASAQYCYCLSLFRMLGAKLFINISSEHILHLCLFFPPSRPELQNYENYQLEKTLVHRSHLEEEHYKTAVTLRILNYWIY